MTRPSGPIREAFAAWRRAAPIARLVPVNRPLVRERVEPRPVADAFRADVTHSDVRQFAVAQRGKRPAVRCGGTRAPPPLIEAAGYLAQPGHDALPDCASEKERTQCSRKVEGLQSSLG